MKPYYSDSLVTIYHGDCREVLPVLSGAFGLVVTDPPYGVQYSTGYRKRVARSSTALQNDHLLSPLLNDTAALIDPLLNDTAALIDPLLNDTAALYVFAAPERLDAVMPILKAQWDVPNVLVWDKGNCTAGDLDTTYGQQWEAVVYARKARVRLLGGRDRDILRWSRGDVGAYQHPTQKPVGLLEYLIGRHEPTRVLDPFCGSGTTLRAAKNRCRASVGIEIEERYCEIAAERCRQEVLDLGGAA